MTAFLLGVLSGLMIIGAAIYAFFSILGNEPEKLVISVLVIMAALLIPVVFL